MQVLAVNFDDVPKTIERLVKMAAKVPKVKIFHDARGTEWRWHLRSRNGEIVAQGEGYKRKSGAIRAAEKFLQLCACAVIEVEE